jgi:hypothetical protein
MCKRQKAAIRIRIGSIINSGDPDPDWESGSSKKAKIKKFIVSEHEQDVLFGGLNASPVR